MPTGFTAGVQNGTVTDFREYALLCVRAFGAAIELRDEPMSSKLPTLEPSDYHQKRAAEARLEHARIEAMTLAECTSAARADFDQQIAYWRDVDADKQVQRHRYETMLAKAKAFKPPTPEHDKFAAFLVKQLEESIAFDCSDTSAYRPILPSTDGTQWKADKLAKLQHDIEYHDQHYREECERTKGRNEWIQAIKQALGL